jgi:hypothetical protein
MLAPTSKALYAEQHTLFDGSGDCPGPDEFGGRSRRPRAQRNCVLLTKHRADARMPTTIGNVGSGKIEVARASTSITTGP